MKSRARYQVLTEQKVKNGEGIANPSTIFKSYSPFKQGEFIRKINKPDFLSSLISKPIFDAKGICAGLVFVWYAYMQEGLNLLDSINEQKGSLSPDLIRHLQKSQQKYSFSLIKNKNISIPKNHIKEMQKLYLNFEENQEQLMADYNFTNAIEAEWVNSIYLDKEVEDKNAEVKHSFFASLSIKNIGEIKFDFSKYIKSKEEIQKTDVIERLIDSYFKKIEQYHRHEYGLHVLSIIEITDKVVKGHVIGWTRVEDGFVMFDPNVGELYFPEYKEMYTFLKETLLPKYGSLQNLVFRTRDFYDSNDENALVEMRRSERLVESFRKYS
ncbi:MAG: YopT-type cysteine protease domain-containing protein [Gammaproteobacteria bacterium]